MLLFDHNHLAGLLIVARLEGVEIDASGHDFKKDTHSPGYTPAQAQRWKQSSRQAKPDLLAIGRHGKAPQRTKTSLSRADEVLFQFW